jgi:hypothetical protein
MHLRASFNNLKKQVENKQFLSEINYIYIYRCYICVYFFHFLACIRFPFKSENKLYKNKKKRKGRKTKQTFLLACIQKINSRQKSITSGFIFYFFSHLPRYQNQYQIDKYCIRN